jgi:hypothetical protein
MFLNFTIPKKDDDFSSNRFRNVFMADTDEAGNVKDPTGEDPKKEDDKDNKEETDKKEDKNTDEAGNVKDPTGENEENNEEAGGNTTKPVEEDAADKETSNATTGDKEAAADARKNKKLVDASKRIDLFNRHRSLYKTVDVWINVVSSALPNIVSEDIRTNFLKIQKDLSKTSGQLEYALSMDFTKMNIERIEEIYNAIKKKIDIMAEQVIKMRKAEIQNKK